MRFLSCAYGRGRTHKGSVAGIAMGLVKDTESDRVAIMSDIQGMEDFLGDMDFKVAGTAKALPPFKWT